MAEPSALLIGPAVMQGPVLVTTTSEDHATQNTAAPDYLLSAYQRLTEFSELPQDWDSYGAVPIRARAIHGAERLFSLLARQFPAADVAPYTLAPLANGGVQVEWRGSARALEIEVDPSGRLSGLLAQDGESGRSYDERSRISITDATNLVSYTLGL